MSEQPRRGPRRKGKVLKAHPVIPEPVRHLVFAPSLRHAEEYAYQQGWTAGEWRHIRKETELAQVALTDAPRHLVQPPGTRLDNDTWKAWQALTGAAEASTEEVGLF